MSKESEINAALIDLIDATEQELTKAKKEEEKERARALSYIQLNSKDLLESYTMFKHYPPVRLKFNEKLILKYRLVSYSYGPLQKWCDKIDYGQLILDYEAVLKKNPSPQYHMWEKFYSLLDE